MRMAYTLLNIPMEIISQIEGRLSLQGPIICDGSRKSPNTMKVYMCHKQHRAY